MKNDSSTTAGRQRWEAPRVEILPRLTELTLQTSGGFIPVDTTFSVNYSS
ncbi:MAG TPA: hypothetical protein VE913_07360 [Longimicrobium sp.]|nr:hypothetical protein [Longimicrobium sp.]